MTLTDITKLGLTPDEVDEFGRELDALRDEIFDSRADADRAYILRMITTQRAMALSGRITALAAMAVMPGWSHGAAGWVAFLGLLGLAVALMALAKILENMEIGHNVLHSQWDWMHDPQIQSSTWEWDHAAASEEWMVSHNVTHHTWTNVVGKDPDVGYGALRVTPSQRWHRADLLQPLMTVVLAVFFEWFIAIHNLGIRSLLSGERKWAEVSSQTRVIRAKASRQFLKDYVLWPALSVLFALPFLVVASGPSPLALFGWTLAANALANIVRNLWTFAIIICGHFPDDVHYFSEESVENETRSTWYVRQMLGSCNIEGGRLFHVMSGNLSHQIEHHLFPDMPSNRYAEIAPRVRALADRFGLPYNSARFGRQLGTTFLTLARLTFPGPEVGDGDDRGR